MPTKGTRKSMAFDLRETVKEKITFQRLTCFSTPTAKPLQLALKRYMPPNSFKIKEPAMMRLKAAKSTKIHVWGVCEASMHQAIFTKTKIYTISTVVSKRCPRVVPGPRAAPRDAKGSGPSCHPRDV